MTQDHACLAHDASGPEWFERLRRSEKANYDLVTFSKSAYDNRDAVVAPGNDPWAKIHVPASTGCGTKGGPRHGHALLYLRIIGGREDAKMHRDSSSLSRRIARSVV